MKAWILGCSLLYIGFVITLAWGWSSRRQVDSYDQATINDLFEDITMELKR